MIIEKCYRDSQVEERELEAAYGMRDESSLRGTVILDCYDTWAPRGTSAAITFQISGEDAFRSILSLRGPPPRPKNNSANVFYALR